jgi:broad specificity phosphatase PhoE
MNMNMMPTKTIRFIRHGETDFNVDRIWQGHSQNSQLTENGRIGAEQLGVHLKDIPINLIYTSKLKRAIETGQHLSKHMGYNGQIHQHKVFNERYMGKLEGRSRDQDHSNILERKDIEILEGLNGDDDRYTQLYETFMNVEPLCDIKKRVKESLNLIAQSSSTSIMVITHGMFLNTLIHMIDPNHEKINISNCSIITVEYTHIPSTDKENTIAQDSFKICDFTQGDDLINKT